MSPWLAATGAFPSIVAMLYVDRLDAKRPEPARTLRLVALAGGLSVIACAGLQWGVSWALPTGGYLGAVSQAFVAAAAVEELAKALCLRAVVWNRPELDERIDCVVYATRAGLGFALVENVLYLLRAPSLTAFAATYTARAVLTVPMHAVSAALMGYFAARRRFDHVGPGPIGGYFVAVGLHGAFDAGLFSSVVAATQDQVALSLSLILVSTTVVIVGVLIARRLAKTLLALDDEGVVTRRRQRLTFFG